MRQRFLHEDSHPNGVYNRKKMEMAEKSLMGGSVNKCSAATHSHMVTISHI